MRRLLMTLALAAFAVGCSDSTSPNNNPVGTWKLATFNGSAMPALYYQDTQSQVYIESATLNINNDGTFAEIVAWHAIAGTQESSGTDVDGGTWSMTSNTITFDGNAQSYTGTLEGSTITETGGDTWVYRRQ